jgi:glucose-6-phosphate isomerase
MYYMSMDSVRRRSTCANCFPFNQPGVEAYKKNMFALLNKPGYEKESEAIRARLKK